MVFPSIYDLKINYGTTRIVKNDIRRQFERRDVSGATDRAKDNSHASL